MRKTAIKQLSSAIDDYSEDQGRRDEKKDRVGSGNRDK